MAEQADHIALANRTQATINLLCTDVALHAPWIATCAFYKALHVIEAIFFSDPEVKHTPDHAQRFDALRTHVRYEQIYRDYVRLWWASCTARYLEDR